ncbi:molybdopterin molybdotransferase MoeA [Desulfotalea psychrophila]|uniref:Molybdopterin molybdenumtransferase n=1 Tax=Desulfotalea psychrophila (strain LSv54 / DSM 12343) TaxID=177439 RepID=Q6AKC2_DESPS|nr:gephyrin-like molybdotransferase Glp [Desulfotalea psychrophila]CAG37203.1 related to molybdenum cofactor biosynthesis protein (MoeA) [Desulfotalea psychrophila LSv54]
MIAETKDMLGRNRLTAVDQALQIFLQQLPTGVIDTETITLEEALDRVVAGDIIARENLPAMSRSCMDGYALSARDSYGASESMPAYLEIQGEVLMGEVPNGRVKQGCCYKIPTGGILPTGSNSVVMFEHTIPVDETLVEIVKGVGEGGNISRPGEDIAAGACAITAGTRLRPQDLGLLAGLGFAEVEVYRRPRIAILSTGDEIISHEQPLLPGKIRNINSIALAAQVRRLHATVQHYGIIPDNYDLFLATMREAVQENDIVLFSGGSSVGVRDLGEKIIETLGPPGILIHGTALKPGKPIILGMSETTAVVGLPGHPVSAMTCFDLFIAPAIKQLAGQRRQRGQQEASVPAILTRNINSAPGRRDVVRVQLEQKGDEVYASPVLGKSGSISVLARADGYFFIDEASQGHSEGDRIKAFLYL